jgi:hypothetical protein
VGILARLLSVAGMIGENKERENKERKIQRP